jgi:very-short-patch-repair endonuclease/DNA-binding XRE family transcriptional regulator
MPKMKITKTELLRLLKDIDLEIDENDLSSNPKYLLVLRLNAGMSQNQFENFLGISKNSYKYETGKIKKMSLKTAKKFLACVNNRIDNERVVMNYNKFEAESKGWMKVNSDSKKASEGRQKGAIISLSKRSTNQEKEVAKLLLKKGIPFKTNFVINNKCIVDFKVVKPKLIIECKKLITKNRREQSKKMRELAYQGYKAKFYDHDSQLIAIIETEMPLRPIDFEELIGPFDKVFDGVNKFFLYLDQTI